VRVGYADSNDAALPIFIVAVGVTDAHSFWDILRHSNVASGRNPNADCGMVAQYDQTLRP